MGPVMRTIVTLAALLCPVVALACSANPASPGGPGETRVTLAPGESATSGAVQLRFDEVVQDSRCPPDVDCVWEGLAEVAITVTTGGRATPYRLFTSNGPDSIVHEGVTVQLARLAPERSSERPTEPREYRATFVLRR
jgi:hypothetical protein